MALCSVAVVQMTSTNDKAGNLQTAERLVREAKARGASFVALPECCNFFGLDSAESVAAAEDLGGEGIAAWSAMASRHAVWLALGGIKVVSDEPARPTNSHLLIAPNGSIVARYDKVHLFDIDLPAATFMESAYTKGGTELVCADTALGRVGLSTCYDLRFPSLYAALTQRGGAEIVLVPAAWTSKTFPHWEILLRARAIETQSYIIAAAQVGRHSANRTSPGGAMIVDPWGTVVARCEGERESVAVATLDLEHVRALRRRMPLAAHAQPDVYASEVRVVVAADEHVPDGR